jgi:hypothetical protein
MGRRSGCSLVAASAARAEYDRRAWYLTGPGPGDPARSRAHRGAVEGNHSDCGVVEICRDHVTPSLASTTCEGKRLDPAIARTARSARRRAPAAQSARRLVKRIVRRAAARQLRHRHPRGGRRRRQRARPSRRARRSGAWGRRSMCGTARRCPARRTAAHARQAEQAQLVPRDSVITRRTSQVLAERVRDEATSGPQARSAIW